MIFTYIFYYINYCSLLLPFSMFELGIDSTSMPSSKIEKGNNKEQ